MKWLYFFLLIILTEIYSFAQVQEILFPHHYGQELIDSLVVNYKTNIVLSYDNARDTLFAKIYNHNDSVSCVYTGYTIYIDPHQRPASYAYKTANFQTEHTWPQSVGAEGQAKCDMHHLYPVWGSVNASRGNEPFEELNDSETQKWWYLNNSYTNPGDIPRGCITLSSKRGKNGGFEPREDHKGNVARAMFYFYTMYKNQIDLSFFTENQNDILFRWNKIDPVDSLEQSRNEMIALYQGSHPNPFIIDTTLITRAYFTEVGVRILESNIKNEYKAYFNYPNPFNSTTIIRYQIPQRDNVKIILFDLLGQQIKTLVNDEKTPGSYQLIFKDCDLPSGVYFYSIQAGNFVSIHKMVLLK